MSRTNEQVVVEAKENIALLKRKYLDRLQDFVNTQPTPQKAVQVAFLACQQAGNEYFNYVEEFVGNSDLLGAHSSDLWVTGFAEDCAEVLRCVPAHLHFLRSHAMSAGLDVSTIEPGPHAYANMQRFVAKYLSRKDVKELKGRLKESKVPIRGFQKRASKDTGQVWSPMEVIREAIKAVPAVRYALGIGGIVATIAIIYSFKISAFAAVFGTVVMLVLMTVLVLFARTARATTGHLAAHVFTWFSLVLFMLVAFFLFTSAFFAWPLDLTPVGSPHVEKAKEMGRSSGAQDGGGRDSSHEQVPVPKIYKCTIKTDPIVLTHSESHKARNNSGLDEYRAGRAGKWKADLEAQGHKNVVVTILAYGPEGRDHGDYVYDLEFKAEVDGGSKYGPDPRCIADEPPPN